MYIYRAQGICPAEIHFQLTDNKLSHVRFVGGGCVGNARLISRLLEGQDADAVLPLMKGIQCRNNTSCPDQLSRAVALVKEGRLAEADPITVYEAPAADQEAAVFAGVAGNIQALEKMLQLPVPAVYSLGDLTRPGEENDAIVELARKKKLAGVKGPVDQTIPCAQARNQDYLIQAPYFLRFQIGPRKALGFHGGFIQELPGFSDFSPYSLELLMVSNLSDYLRNESVYPALETMAEQFSVDVVLFAQTGLWKHVRLGGVDFVSVGAVVEDDAFKYARLKWEQDELQITFETIKP
ncbi:TIGR03905 family TSCPD domain-containing protein [Desulfotomaculum copahuensis]|uniref:ribonucleoside-diphosphate reductase n=1 Tax=Desulfotomaculum copahuensis TaxID=1838280 RepID=A0A1B7LIB6_9FIRM|nr:TIGR03905 family protein [Desulfotomaculum copahuensis]